MARLNHLRSHPRAAQVYLVLVSLVGALGVLALVSGSTILSAAAVLAVGAAALISTRGLVLPGTAIALGVALVLAVPSRFVLAPISLPLSLVLGLAMLALWLVQRLVSDRALARTDLLVFALVAAAMLSQAVGLLRVLGDVEEAAANRRLVELLALCGVCLFTADSLHDRAAVERVVLGVIAGCGIAAFIGLLQWSTGADVTTSLALPGLTRNPAADEALSQIYLRMDMARITGTTLHPIELGVLLAAALPLSLHALRWSRSLFGQAVSLLTLCMSLLAIPLTLSRAAVLGVVVALVALMPWLAWKHRLAILGSLLAVFLVVAAVVPNTVSVMAEIITDPSADQGSIASRQSDYEAVEEYFAERPLTGRGYGSFAPTEYFWLDNQYLRTLVESGVLGLTALLSMYLGALAFASSSAGRFHDSRSRSLSRSLFASLAVCVVAAGTFDGLSFPSFAVISFLLVGCIGAVDRLAREEPRILIRVKDPGRPSARSVGPVTAWD